MDKQVTIYTDGSSSVKNGTGGWCYIAVDSNGTRTAYGAEVATTNNRMELKAAIEGLSSLEEPHTVQLVSDSNYLVRGIKEWMDGWEFKAEATGKPLRYTVKNGDLWETILALSKVHTIRCVWVKGHIGHPYNEECDRVAGLARKAIEQLLSAENLKSKEITECEEV